MAGRFVRASKYRHVFGKGTKKEQCYDNLRISKNAWDTNLIKANPEYISVNWEASGGGAFAVIPVNETGRAPELMPLFRGHTAAVLDTDWYAHIPAMGGGSGRS
jgi:coronin-1B/1C/6